MSNVIFYRKQGRKYLPVSEYDSEKLDSFPLGNHLVMCYPGGQSRRYNVDPALAPMVAAGRYAEDVMAKAMQAASEMRPSTRPVTEEQREAWRHLSEAFGDERYGLTIASTHDIIDAGVKAMQVEADRMLTHPTVRKAYEKFLMVYQLTKEQETNN